MQLNNDELCRNAQAICNKQLKQLAKSIRQELVHKGLNKEIIDPILRKCVKDILENHSSCEAYLKLYSTTCSSHDGKEHRGADPIGRILVEYCFIKTPDAKMIWPERSEQDEESRSIFVEGVIPRPLMRYFLVSIRGSIPELNKFEAHSVLFGAENELHEQRTQYAKQVIEEFLDNKTNTIDWKSVYEDSRFQKLAVDMIGDIRRSIEQFGLERYLRILENFRQRDPDRETLNKMNRSFHINDAKQIDDALWQAEGKLAHDLSE